MKKIIRNTIILIIIIIGIISILIPILKNTKFGLDLQGGFEILYEIEPLNKEDKLTNTLLVSTSKEISKRIDKLGVSEPDITIEGKNKIRVKLAGVKNQEEAEELISKPFVLSFRDINDNVLATSDILNTNGAKVGYDTSYVVQLDIKDKEKFQEITSTISKKPDGENLIVMWLNFEEGVDSFKNEQNCGNLEISKCLSSARVTQTFASDVVITGNFTQQQVEQLVEKINLGNFPTKLTEISSKTVDAVFGKDSLNKTITAGIIGISFVMLFMVFLYRLSGLITNIGLIIYGFLTFLTFWLIGGVLTLPGIAALVLGIGMAVDANVISFERIKDLIKEGKSLKEAFNLGYEKSFLTILDANITTLIVAVILFIFGESSIKGFATMLIINIFVTMFVMVFVVKFILKRYVNNKIFDKHTNLFIGYKNKTKEKTPFDYVSKTKIFASISVIFIIIGVILTAIFGLKLGIDYKGGSDITLISDTVITREQITNDIKELNLDFIDYDSINNNTVYIKISNILTKDETNTVSNYFQDKYQAKADIGVISNIVKKELTKNALISCILAFVGIIIYVSFRFKFSYGISSVIALVHDVLMIFVFFALLRLEINIIFIAAILTIIGYSINDTVVIFDRIRDERKTSKKSLKEIVNTSLQSVFKRTIYTSVTTIFCVLSLIIFGSFNIVNFNIALLIGLIAGVYSSLYIVCGLWYMIEIKSKPKKVKEHKDELDEMLVKGINS